MEDDCDDLQTAVITREREEALSEVASVASTISTAVSELSNEVARGDEVWRLFAGITARLRQLEGQPKPIDGPRLLEDLQAAAEQNRREPDNKLFYNRIDTLVRDAFAKAPTSFFDFFFDPLDGLFP